MKSKESNEHCCSLICRIITICSLLFAYIFSNCRGDRRCSVEAPTLVDMCAKLNPTAVPTALPARPYRRIEPEVLESRIRDLNKRLAVLRSKVVLLEDRLESHTNENEMRKTEAAA